MAKKYIWSKRNNRTLLDTGAINMVRDVLILIGIHADWSNLEDKPQLSEYYTDITNRHCDNKHYRFCGEYHYFNNYGFYYWIYCIR
ncbi:MAG: hypothetical protein Q4A12_01830 [Eubacteriales bacterium]|nr:hypothetical protein [Eubacteriales bacterium]